MGDLSGGSTSLGGGTLSQRRVQTKMYVSNTCSSICDLKLHMQQQHNQLEMWQQHLELQEEQLVIM